MSRSISASVSGGSLAPSGMISFSRRSAALRKVGLKPRMPMHTVDKTRGFPDQRFTLPVGTFRILFLDGRNCYHSAVIGLTAQPPKDDPFKTFGVKAISLRATVFS